MGDGVAEITMQRLQYIHPSFEEEVEKLSGLEGMIKWLQENWWIPLIIISSIIIASVVLNERNQSIVKDIRENYRNKKSKNRNIKNDKTIESQIIEAEIIEAELL